MQHKSFQNRIDVGIDFVASPNVSEIVKTNKQKNCRFLHRFWEDSGAPKGILSQRWLAEGRRKAEAVPPMGQREEEPQAMPSSGRRLAERPINLRRVKRISPRRLIPSRIRCFPAATAKVGKINGG